MARKVRLGAVLAATLGCLALVAGPAAAITTKLPVSTHLTTVPPEVSWPGSRDFEYRVGMTAGDEGAHFIFTVPAPSWGFKGTYGSPFSYFNQPTLDGPGTIKPSMSIVGDPVPWACWRGASADSQNWFEVALDPGIETTVVVPSRLEAAPLAGMTTETDFRIENGDDPVLIPAPVTVGGKPGIRIKTRIAGSDPKLPTTLGVNGRFVLRGFTQPALADRKIVIRAIPISVGTGGGKTPGVYRLVTVRTDAEGNFKSAPQHIKFRPAAGSSPSIWSFMSRLESPGGFVNKWGCGPTLFLRDFS